MKSRDIVWKSNGKKFCKLKSDLLLLLFTGNAYPSKPKIDGVGLAKYYEKNTKYISSLQNCDWTRKQTV